MKGGIGMSRLNRRGNPSGWRIQSSPDEVKLNAISDMEEKAANLYNTAKYENSAKIWKEIICLVKASLTKKIVVNKEFLANALFMHAQCLRMLGEDTDLMLQEYQQAYTFNPTRADALEYVAASAMQLNCDSQFKVLIRKQYLSLAQSSYGKEHKSFIKILASEILEEKYLTESPATLLSAAAIDHPLAAIFLMEKALMVDDFPEVKRYMNQLTPHMSGKAGDYLLRFLDNQFEYYRAAINPQRDLEKAMNILRFLISKKPLPGYCYAMAQFYDGLYADHKIEKDAKQAVGYYEKAVEFIPEAAHDLGFKYAYGEDIEQDEKKATDLFALAIQRNYIPSYVQYAYLLLRRDFAGNLNEVLKLWEPIQDVPVIKFFSLQLQLFEAKSIDNGFVVLNVIRKEAATKKEVEKSYDELQTMIRSDLLDPIQAHLISGAILEYWLNKFELAIDHYRIAADLGSKSAHDKLFNIYITGISNAACEQDKKWCVNSLRNVAESREELFEIPPPDWLIPKFKPKKFKCLFGMAEKKDSVEQLYQLEKSLFAVDRFKSLPDRLVQLTNTIKEGKLPANHLGKFASEMGKIAHSLIKESGLQEIRFLYQQLIILLQTVKTYEEKSFNNWSLMSLLECVGQFRLYSKNPVFVGLVQNLFALITKRLPVMIYWKLIMLIENAMNISYQQQGIRKFILTIVNHTLKQWPKIYRERDGDIRLCHNLAIVDKHYGFKLANRLKPLVRHIVKIDLSYYQERTSVMYNCYFALVYFNELYQKMDPENNLLPQLKSLLLSRPCKTTYTLFQSQVENFCVKNFSSPLNWEIKHIANLRESRIVVRPIDLVMAFERKLEFVPVGFEADGPLHFFYNASKGGIPGRDLYTEFATFILTQQGVNMVRTSCFVWNQQSYLQRYQTTQKRLAKIGLDYPNTPEEKPKPGKVEHRALLDKNWREKKYDSLPLSWRKPASSTTMNSSNTQRNGGNLSL